MPYKDPKKKAASQRRIRQEGRGLGSSPGGPPDDGPPLPPLPLKTAADALAMLEEQVNAARADRTATAQVKSRTVGYLVAIALKAIDSTNFAERMAAIEQKLGIKHEHASTAEGGGEGTGEA